MTRYVCNFVPMYKSYIETKHEIVALSVHRKWDRLVIYLQALVAKTVLIRNQKWLPWLPS